MFHRYRTLLMRKKTVYLYSLWSAVFQDCQMASIPCSSTKSDAHPMMPVVATCNVHRISSQSFSESQDSQTEWHLADALPCANRIAFYSYHH